jgi:hypothetical protein
MILTSNLGFGEWPSVFGDAALSRCLSPGSVGASDLRTELNGLLWR